VSGPVGEPRDERPDDHPGTQPKQSGFSNLAGVAAFAVMGTTIATCIGVGVVIGLGVDAWLSTSPWGLFFGIVLGTVAAVVSVVKLVRRFL
jgi:F0F1-type ATP synthase assembly protein I